MLLHLVVGFVGRPSEVPPPWPGEAEQGGHPVASLTDPPVEGVRVGAGGEAFYVARDVRLDSKVHIQVPG